MASIQYIGEIAGGKDAILAQAALDPKIAKKRKPDLDQVSLAVVKVVEQRCIAGAANLVREDLQDALDTYKLIVGDRFMADDPDEWDSGLDDKVEEIFQPYNDVLSADFLATATIDSGLWLDNGVDTVANKFGKEVYRSLAWLAGDRDRPGKIKQPMQILASASILTSDILGYFADRIEQPTSYGESPGTTAMNAIQEFKEAMQLDIAINQLRLWMLDNFTTAIDPEMLGNLVDSDDVIAQGAATQLGLPADAAISFQMLAFDKGDKGAVEYVQEQLALDYAPGGPAETMADAVYDTAIPPPPAVASAPKAAKGDGPRMNEVLQVLKEHGGTTLNDMALIVGVSRGTYNNYLNDKTDWQPDDEAKQRVLDKIEEHMQAMMSARALLEGAN